MWLQRKNKEKNIYIKLIKLLIKSQIKFNKQNINI